MRHFNLAMNGSSEELGEPSTGGRLPLWLNESEASALLVLAGSGQNFCGDALEHTVFERLGDLMRAFWR